MLSGESKSEAIPRRPVGPPPGTGLGRGVLRFWGLLRFRCTPSTSHYLESCRPSSPDRSNCSGACAGNASKTKSKSRFITRSFEKAICQLF